MKISGGQNSYCSIVSDSTIAFVDLMQKANVPTNATYYGSSSICRIVPLSSLIPTAVIAPFVPPASLFNTSTKLGGTISGGFSFRHYMLVVSPTASKDKVLITRNGQNITDSGTLTDAALYLILLTPTTPVPA